MKMRYFIVTFILLLSMQGCSQNSASDFVDKVTSDFSRSSYFIIIRIKFPDGVTESLIENDDLYYFFHKTEGYDEARYKEEISNLIKTDHELNVSETDFSKFGFIKLARLSKLDEEAKMGKDFIVNKYFKNRVIVNGVTFNERNALIKLLFDWNIASKIDDETGYLIIEK